jgi:hypothetical protein
MVIVDMIVVSHQDHLLDVLLMDIALMEQHAVEANVFVNLVIQALIVTLRSQGQKLVAVIIYIVVVMDLV